MTGYQSARLLALHIRKFTDSVQDYLGDAEADADRQQDDKYYDLLVRIDALVTQLDSAIDDLWKKRDLRDWEKI